MENLRKNIDEIDLQIRELLAKRLDLSSQVAASKKAAGSTDIYRADREAAILEKLGADVPEDRKPEYLAIVRKVMETSRMYQYGLLYEWDNSVFDAIRGSELANHPGEKVKVSLSKENKPNAMSAILCMIGDYGYDMDYMELIECNSEMVTFELTIIGDISNDTMRKLIFQLSKESTNFSILENISSTK